MSHRANSGTRFFVALLSFHLFIEKHAAALTYPNLTHWVICPALQYTTQDSRGT